MSIEDKLKEKDAKAGGKSGGPQRPPPPQRPSSLQASLDATAAQEQLKSAGEIAGDVAAGAGSGLARGAVGTLSQLPQGGMGDLVEALRTGYKWWHGDKANPEIANAPNPLPTSQDAIAFAAEQLPEGAKPALTYQPQTTAGKIAQVAGEFTSGAVVPGTVVTRGLRGGERVAAIARELVAQGVAPGVASEAAGQFADRFAPDTPIGTIARVLTPILVGGGTSALRRPGGLPGEVDVPGVGPTRTRAAELAGNTVQDQGGPGPVREQWRQVGPEGVLADTGPRAMGQTEALYTTPGPQQQTIKDFTVQRRESLHGPDSVLNRTLDAYIEPRQHNFADRTEAMTNARRTQARDLYGQAEAAAQGKQFSTQAALDYIDQTLPLSVTSGAAEGLLPHEQRLMQLRQQLAQRTDYQSLHSAQEGLRREIAELKKAGGNTHDLQEVRSRLLEQLEQGTLRPNGTSLYGEARRAYRTDTDLLEAVENGRTLFDRNVRPDEFAREWRDMTPDERTAVRMGARDSVDSKIGPASNDFATGWNTLKSTWNREKLEIMLGREQANALMERLEGLQRQRTNLNTLEQQSATAKRTAGQKEIQNPADPNVVKPPLNEAPNLGQVITGGLRRIHDATLGRMKAAGIRATNADAARLQTARIAERERAAFLERLAQVYERGQQRRPYGVEGGYAGYQGWRSDQ